MAASDYTFYLTRNEIIEEAFKKIGVLTDGDPLSGDMTETARRRLNLIVKDWQSDDVFLWQENTDVIQLSTGKERYDYPNNPPVHCIDKVFLRRRNGDNTYSDTELNFIPYREFQSIYNKSNQGRPTDYTVDVKTQELIPWPVPSERDSLLVLYIAALKDMEVASGKPGDFPVKWHRALMYALAVDLADDYPVSATKYKQLKDAKSDCYLRARGSESGNGDSDFVSNSYD